jgi:hypothetical protein
LNIAIEHCHLLVQHGIAKNEPLYGVDSVAVGDETKMDSHKGNWAVGGGG